MIKETFISNSVIYKLDFSIEWNTFRKILIKNGMFLTQNEDTSFAFIIRSRL